MEMSEDNISGTTMQRKGLLSNRYGDKCYQRNFSTYGMQIRCSILWLLTLFRYQKGEMIVLHSAGNVRSSGRELQLPVMALLTSKMSSQQFLLRILKVIIQLRDSLKQSSKNADSNKNSTGR